MKKILTSIIYFFGLMYYTRYMDALKLLRETRKIYDEFILIKTKEISRLTELVEILRMQNNYNKNEFNNQLLQIKNSYHTEIVRLSENKELKHSDEIEKLMGELHKRKIKQIKKSISNNLIIRNLSSTGIVR